MKWAYGVTTVPKRREDLLPRTLASLKLAGFDRPRLFVDGCSSGDQAMYEQVFGLEVTSHFPAVRTYGNWVLALGELYLRDSSAERYAIFQDDFVTYRNLRKFLNLSPYPAKGYLNLYTFRQNEEVVSGRPVGWHEAYGHEKWGTAPDGRPMQGGKGAVGLVFSREAVQILLRSQHMVERVTDVRLGWRAIDGGVASGMNKAGWREFVHMPSLVQHLGHVSTTHTPIVMTRAQASTFRGEDFDALQLLPQRSQLPGDAQKVSTNGQADHPITKEALTVELARCEHFLSVDEERLSGARNPAERVHLTRVRDRGRARVERVREQLRCRS